MGKEDFRLVYLKGQKEPACWGFKEEQHSPRLSCRFHCRLLPSCLSAVPTGREEVTHSLLNQHRESLPSEASECPGCQAPSYQGSRP